MIKDINKALCISLSLLVSLLLLSCLKKSINNNMVYTIRLGNNTTQSIALTDISKSIRYIPLETNSKCYINNIKKIKFFGDSIFIINQLFWNYKEILVFDTNGKFLGNFGKIGTGPEEIDNPRDIIKYRDKFLVWDKLKISELGFNGDFIKIHFNVFLPGQNFFIDSGKIHLVHGTEYPGLITEYDIHGKPLRTFKPIDPKTTSSSFQGETLIDLNNEHHFFTPSYDTIWMFSKDHVLPKYVFNFMGDITLNSLFRKYKDLLPPQMGPILRSNSPSYVLSYYETNKYIFLMYLKSNKTAYKVINKYSSAELDFKQCKNNIDNGLFGTPISSFNEYFVIPLEPMQLLKYRDQILKSESTLHNIVRDTKEDDNPVLMLIKFDF